MDQNLTEKELQFLESYAFLKKQQGKRPSLSAVTRHMGYRSVNSVRQFMQALHRKGVDPDRYESQKEVIEAPANTTAVPVLGSAPCGQPFFAEQNYEGEIPVDTSLLGGNVRDYFFLKAKGDSMNESGIEDGDYVLFRSQPVADSGERVVALIGDEATIKYFKPGDGYVALVPKSSNKSHKPLIMSEGVQVQGVVKQVIKKELLD